MRAIVERLAATKNLIEKISKISGSVGLSLGVLHEGEVIYTDNVGFRDVEDGVRPDSDTIYHLGSLTKALTAACMAILVEQKKLDWNSKLLDILPRFHQTNKEVEEKSDLTDLLAHRMGLASRINYWCQMNQQLLFPASEAVNVLGALETTGPFRKSMRYNNWTYACAADIIEHATGQGFSDFLNHHFLEPLGLKRTTLGVPSSENYASTYMVLDDGTPYKLPPPALNSGKLLASAGAAKSSVNDLLKFYGSLLAAIKHQKAASTTSTPNSPFCQTTEMLSPHNAKGATSYGLGWFLTELPGEIGWIGINDSRVGKMPIIARGTAPREIAYHNGNMPGALSSVHMIPSSGTAIVVLGNSLPFSDVPDLVGGILLEALLDCPEPTDFIALAEKARETSIAQPKATQKELKEEQKLGTPMKDLSSYAGRYINNVKNFYLDVTPQGGGLHMTVQGFANTCYDLYHYQDDTFAWDCDREAELKKAMFPSWYKEYHKIHFNSNSNGEVNALVWSYGRDIPDGETFDKVINESDSKWGLLNPDAYRLNPDTLNLSR
jgi:CubicO group peptidase (beta-lactamase class C family)